MTAPAVETPYARARRLFLVYLDTRTEGAFQEWFDANRACGEVGEAR